MPEFITADFAPETRALPPSLPDGQFVCAWSVFIGEPGESPNQSNNVIRMFHLEKTQGLNHAQPLEAMGTVVRPPEVEALGGFVFLEDGQANDGVPGPTGSTVYFDGFMVNIKPGKTPYPSGSEPINHAQDVDLAVKVYQDLLR